MSRPALLALIALAAVTLAGCGNGGSKTVAATPRAARRGGKGRAHGPSQPPASSLPYEQHLLPFHAAPLDATQRRQLTSSGETEIPINLKKPGSLSAFGQAQLGLSIVRVANAAPIESDAGTADLELRLTARARRLLARGGSMLMYVAIRFSGSRIRQQLTVPLHG
jgi:hypothetical protein